MVAFPRNQEKPRHSKRMAGFFFERCHDALLSVSASCLKQADRARRLGEHTAEVLQRVLGVAPSEIASLHREGVLFEAGLAKTKQH